VRSVQLPEWLWWDHNAHYHRWLLRQVPARGGRVLDVGCGSGRLACLIASSTGAHVDAIDRSSVMIKQAQARCADVANVRWLEGDVLDPGLPLAADGYDAVTALSSLHHMPLDTALDRLATLVRPGGALAVVGLYRPATVTDYALVLVALPANALVGTALAARGRAGKPDDHGMPVLAPSTTLAELRTAVGVRLPGARIRRGLYWRYLLTWRRRPR
jgi:SAM-dependent methyltransferase